MSVLKLVKAFINEIKKILVRQPTLPLHDGRIQLDLLQAADFTAYVQQRFHIYAQSGTPLEAELVAVKQISAKPGAGTAKRKPFSIVFRCSDKPPLAQGIYKVENEKMGTLDIFIIPIGPDDEGFCYEAVFN
jgi:hypothetical protein